MVTAVADTETSSLEFFGGTYCDDSHLQVVVGRTGDQTLTSESGDVTRHDERLQVQFAPTSSSILLSYCVRVWCSHLQGMFFRTAKMLEVGMKPV